MYEMKIFNYNVYDLEPYIDYKTLNMQLQLMKNYYDELNKLLLKNNYDYRYTIEELINHIDIFYIDDRDDIAFYLGGILNHISYFDSISPYNKNVLNGNFMNAINNKYGSFSNFKNIFIDTAMKLVGSGYTHLVIDKYNNLNIINTANEDTTVELGYIPIITLDLWEHAYLLKNSLNKKKYIESFFDIIDFAKINNRYINIVTKK